MSDEAAVLSTDADKGVVDRARPSAWPFLAYDGVWVVFVALCVQQLTALPDDVATIDAALYPLMIAVGVALCAGGPALAFAVWFSRLRESDDRTALLTDCLMRGATATLIGVVMWWAGLVLVDLLRFGRVF